MDEEEIRELMLRKHQEANKNTTYKRRLDLEEFMQQSYSLIGNFLGFGIIIPRFAVINRPLLSKGVIAGFKDINDEYSLERKIILI